MSLLAVTACESIFLSKYQLENVIHVPIGHAISCSRCVWKRIHPSTVTKHWNCVANVRSSLIVIPVDEFEQKYGSFILFYVILYANLCILVCFIVHITYIC